MSFISFEDFNKIEVRVGTIISAEINNKLKKPAFILSINFGKIIGIKKSSSQLKANYTREDLIHKQVIAVINFSPKQIGNILSEVLVLALPDENNEPILVLPDFKIKNGKKLY